MRSVEWRLRASELGVLLQLGACLVKDTQNPFSIASCAVSAACVHGGWQMIRRLLLIPIRNSFNNPIPTRNAFDRVVLRLHHFERRHQMIFKQIE